MIEVRKLKSSDVAQKNSEIKYVIQFKSNSQYFTKSELIELQTKLNTLAITITDQSEQLACDYFEVDNVTSSATKCKNCWREEWLHEN
jgi:hypothetical protein